MDRLSEQETTKRRYLSGDTFNNRKQIKLDMESVYKDIDSGMSIKMITEKYRVSRTTLYRRHMEYQKMIAKMEEKASEKGSEKESFGDNYPYPPLPEKFML